MKDTNKNEKVKGKRGRKKATEFVMPSTASDKLAIENAVKEASHSVFRVESETTLRKEIAARMKDEYGLSAKDFNAMVQIYHKQNLGEVEVKHERIVELYTKILGTTDA